MLFIGKLAVSENQNRNTSLAFKHGRGKNILIFIGAHYNLLFVFKLFDCVYAVTQFCRIFEVKFFSRRFHIGCKILNHIVAAVFNKLHGRSY